MDSIVVEQFERLLSVVGSEADWPEVEASGFLDYFAHADAAERVERFSTLLPMVLLEAPRLDSAPITRTMLGRLLHPSIGLSDLEAFPGDDGGSILAMAFRTAQIAGWANEIERLTMDYATNRSQFNKPISKFQAVQQQLAVLAEECVAVRMACTLLFTGDPKSLNAVRVRAAALQVQMSARVVARIAHAIHGAIGISTEYRLGNLVEAIHKISWFQGGAQASAIDIGRAVMISGRTILDQMRSL